MSCSGWSAGSVWMILSAQSVTVCIQANTGQYDVDVVERVGADQVIAYGDI